MNPIIQAILQAMPGVIGLVQQEHAAAQPGAPVPTSEEIVAAFEETFTSTVMKDELIRAANQPH